MDISRHGLSKALNGELASVVVRSPRESTEASGRGDIDDKPPAPVSRALAHAPDAAHRDPGGAVEQRLHVALDLLLGRVLRVPRQRVARVVDYDVEAQLLLRPAPPSLLCFLER